METTYCPDCRAERAIVQPPCADGHFECPEWACIECGAAIFVGWLSIDVAVEPPRARRKTA